MEIDLTKINKEILIECIKEYNHEKDYFNNIINSIQNTSFIEEIDNEHIQFWNDLIDHHIYISNHKEITESELNKVKCMAKISLMINVR